MPLSLAIVGAEPVAAQMTGDGATGIGGATQRLMRGARQNPGKPVVAPPPVLPGTKASPEAAAPTAAPADMSPNEALFDAINRGDVASARDAVNRGAELNGRNLLGLTPLELSVDLGRNDISFMLLSMREADASSRNLARRGTTPENGDQSAAILRASTTTMVVTRSRTTSVYERAPAEAIPESPRLFSGNGGTPIPAAGFLGFNGGR